MTSDRELEGIVGTLPAGTRTDLELLRAEGSCVELRSGYIVVSSRSRPSYHWGNCVYVLEDAANVDRWGSPCWARSLGTSRC